VPQICQRTAGVMIKHERSEQTKQIDDGKAESRHGQPVIAGGEQPRRVMQETSTQRQRADQIDHAAHAGQERQQ